MDHLKKAMETLLFKFNIKNKNDFFTLMWQVIKFGIVGCSNTLIALAIYWILEEIGILVDCSITPGIYHKAPGTSVQHANNYKKASEIPHKIGKNLIEVPMTTRTYRTLNGKKIFRKISYS